MPENLKTPEIRFVGFADAWEHRKLNSVFDSIPNNTLSRADLNYDSGVVKNVHYGDILIKYGAVTDCSVEKIPFITGGEVADYKSQFLRDGDVLFADTAEDETVGKVTEIGGVGDGFIVSGLHTVACRPNVNMAPSYLGYYLNSSSFHNQLLSLMQGIKVLSVSKTNLYKTTLTYPASEQEQSQIGDTFATLDRLITLHQREYDKMVNIKKAMLEKMFPKDGADKPEIRFAGFTDAWEKRKLGEFCIEFKSGTFIRADDINVIGKYPVYGGNGLRGYAERYNHDGEYALIGRQGALCGNMIFSSGKAYFTEHAVAVKANNSNNTRFLFYLFSTMNLGQYSGQSAQPGLAVSNLIELETLLPKKTEQEHIALALTSLDNLITLHQRELKKLQNMKKALLEKMFVSASRVVRGVGQ